jgi:hypothetical protein
MPIFDRTLWNNGLKRANLKKIEALWDEEVFAQIHWMVFRGLKQRIRVGYEEKLTQLIKTLEEQCQGKEWEKFKSTHGIKNLEEALKRM